MWLGTKDFMEKNPLEATIVQFAQTEKDNLIAIDYGKGLRWFSIFGENKNKLMTSLTDDTDNWIGKKIKITLYVDPNTNKNIRKIL